MIKAKKRYFVLAGLVILLVLTGYLNYRFNNQATNDQTTAAQNKEDDSQQTGSSLGFFESFRLERDETRIKETEYIDAIINHEETDAETLKDAQQQKLDLATAMEKELTIEGLIKAKGFEDAVVTLHAGSVNVIVDAEQLSSQQVAQILDIVQRESGEKSENIKIMPKN
ncbi:MAG: SpoIIIAH-like family protein [Christensenellales bacterium]